MVNKKKRIKTTRRMHLMFFFTSLPPPAFVIPPTNTCYTCDFSPYYYPLKLLILNHLWFLAAVRSTPRSRIPTITVLSPAASSFTSYASSSVELFLLYPWPVSLRITDFLTFALALLLLLLLLHLQCKRRRPDVCEKKRF